jgi:hypothetical protein
MANSRLTTFRDVKFEEMVRTLPKNRRDRRNRASSPKSEQKALPQRTQRSTEEDFNVKGAEAAKKEGQRAVTAEVAKNAEEGRALPQRTQRNTEEDDFTAENAEVAETEEKATPTFTAKSANSAKEEKPEEGTTLTVEDSLEPRNAEVNPGLPPHHAKTPRAGDPGVESAKSLFFGDEVGEGVADNRPVTPSSELPRKGSQSEILMVPEEVKHHAER